jgi:hypothetical protein
MEAFDPCPPPISTDVGNVVETKNDINPENNHVVLQDISQEVTRKKRSPGFLDVIPLFDIIPILLPHDPCPAVSGGSVNVANSVDTANTLSPVNNNRVQQTIKQKIKAAALARKRRSPSNYLTRAYDYLFPSVNITNTVTSLNEVKNENNNLASQETTQIMVVHVHNYGNGTLAIETPRMANTTTVEVVDTEVGDSSRVKRSPGNVLGALLGREKNYSPTAAEDKSAAEETAHMPKQQRGERVHIKLSRQEVNRQKYNRVPTQPQPNVGDKYTKHSVG